ncbi:MAG TPA: substrate-binding domain-containing protein, partial [Acidimicrobiales bacterium]|nr:substrate-binding domain-containing protein [Acidimicrobiales bacterium]
MKIARSIGRVRHLAVAAAVLSLAGLTAACATSKAPVTTTPSGVPSSLTVSSFNVNFSEMSALKSLTTAGTGLVGVILPDETSSTRYVDFDAPYLMDAFKDAGYPASDYKVENALGVDATELADAEAYVAEGAKVVIFDPIDSTVGAQVQSYLQSHGVAAISYDRATFTGTNTYYVSFDNYLVGQLIGRGFEQCVSSWNVTTPEVFELDGGEDTDPNAVSFADGYNSILWGKEGTGTPPLMGAGTTNSLGYTLVGDEITPGWVNATGATEFTEEYTAHSNINATIEANDGLANAVIGDLRSVGVGPKKIPTTGQDATLQGMEWILQGYQCGSVYKPIYEEAQDAVVLATILRAGKTPPATLVNSTTSPPKNVTGSTQPASLLTPEWVTTSNMASTVIKD